MNLYHYTPAQGAVMILRSGVLKASTHALLPNDPIYAWFSKNPVMEHTALNMARSFGTDQTAQIFGKEKLRQVRFRYLGDMAAMIPWAKLKMRGTLRRQLEAKAKKWGAYPFEFFGFPGDVPANDLQLEDQVAGVWTPMEPQQLLEEFKGIRFIKTDEPGNRSNTTQIIWQSIHA